MNLSQLIAVGPSKTPKGPIVLLIVPLLRQMDGSWNWFLPILGIFYHAYHALSTQSERLTIERESLSRQNRDATHKDEVKGQREKEGKENEEEEKDKEDEEEKQDE